MEFVILWACWTLHRLKGEYTMKPNVSFSSKNLDSHNGSKEYLVRHHKEKGPVECLGVAYKSKFGQWCFGDCQYTKFKELKAVVRHKYLGTPLKDSGEY